MKRICTIFAAAILAAASVHAGVIAEWDFSDKDALNGKYRLVTRGASSLADGRLVVPYTGIEKPAGAITARVYPELSPKRAFSLAIVFRLDEKQRGSNSILWDSKYVASPGDNPAHARYHRGFQLSLDVNSREKDSYYPRVFLGFGQESVQKHGRAVLVEPGRDHTLTMFFDSCGKLRFEFDGQDAGSATVRPGALAPADLPVTLGDRHGSNFMALGGGISKVTLSEEECPDFCIGADVMHRYAFERGEKAPLYYATIYNASGKDAGNLTLTAKVKGGARLGAAKVERLAASTLETVSFPIDTWLMPGRYEVELTLEDDEGKTLASGGKSFFIAPEYGHFFPVILWGGSDKDTVKSLGFTHQVAGIVPSTGQWSQSLLPDVLSTLDGNLEKGLYCFNQVHGQYRFISQNRHIRLDKKGNPYPRKNIEASNPEVVKEYVDICAATARAVPDHPAWVMELSNSEVRDASNLSYPDEPARFREYSGFDIPPYVIGKTSPGLGTVPGAPWDSVLKDDAPDLVFYRWFWREGDGWNNLHSAVTKAFHDNIRHHFMTFYDPVVRVPPLWGSGGDADMVSQWTYTYPDPIKIGQATDEVIAMAQGKPGQKVMSMTQAIWYRSATAPRNVKVENPPEWLSREPEAQYITIAPDFLREAIWSKISRRIDGIMYHGSGSLISVEKHNYRYTNPKSKEVLKDMSERVLKPIGQLVPMIPERKPEVAILESFTSCIYGANEFPYGWSRGWIADLHQALQWAGMQPVVLFEEHLFNDLDTENLKVLFVPYMDIVTEKLLDKINGLQARGVIIVGDNFTNSAVMLDARFNAVDRKAGDPAWSKAELQKLGAEIAATLAPHYKSGMHASNQDIVLRRRGTDDADYVFALNDRRTFGDYVGQWGLVMDKGLPNSGDISIDFPAAAAYDLVAHRPVKLKKSGAAVSYRAEFGPGDGQLVMLLRKPIASVNAAVGGDFRRGGRLTIDIAVLDKDGIPVKALVPLQVSITDSRGNTLPGSGYWVAEGGVLNIGEVAASNMAAGKCRLRVKCLASGKEVKKSFEIKQ